MTTLTLARIRELAEPPKSQAVEPSSGEIQLLAQCLLDWVRIGVGPEWSKYAEDTALSMVEGESHIRVHWKKGGLEPLPPPPPTFAVRDVDLLASRAMARFRAQEKARGATVPDLPRDCAHCRHWDPDPVEHDGTEHRCWEHTLVNPKGIATKTRVSTARQSCEQWESK